MCIRRDPVRSLFIAANGFFIYFSFALNYPSLKEEVDSKGISQSWTGIILGVYSLPSFFFWIFFDKLVHRFGRKCILLFAFYSFIISLFLFGFIEYSESTFFFVFFGLITRFLLGITSYQHKTVLYSVGAKKFPGNINKVFAYISMGVNLGIGVAGFMGSYTYFALNRNIFYVNGLFSAIMLGVGAPMTHYLLTEPKSAHRKKTSDIPARVDTFAVEKTVSFKYLVCDCKLAVHHLLVFWYTVQQNFWMTSLRKQLSQEHEQSQFFIALVYLAPGTTHFFVTIFAPWIMAKCGRPNTALIGGTFNLIGFVFFGPLEFLPREASFVMIGAILQGFGYPLYYIPLVPQIIDTVLAKNPRFYIGPVTDKASSLAYLGMDTGAIMGTVLGDLTYNAFGFRRMVLLFDLAHLLIMALFFFFGKQWKICRSCERASRAQVIPKTTDESPSTSRKLKNAEQLN